MTTKHYISEAEKVSRSRKTFPDFLFERAPSHPVLNQATAPGGGGLLLDSIRSEHEVGRGRFHSFGGVVRQVHGGAGAAIRVEQDA